MITCYNCLNPLRLHANFVFFKRRFHWLSAMFVQSWKIKEFLFLIDWEKGKRGGRGVFGILSL